MGGDAHHRERACDACREPWDLSPASRCWEKVPENTWRWYCDHLHPYVPEGGLELPILLSPPPKCYDYWPVLPLPVLFYLLLCSVGVEPRASCMLDYRCTPWATSPAQVALLKSVSDKTCNENEPQILSVLCCYLQPYAHQGGGVLHGVHRINLGLWTSRYWLELEKYYWRIQREPLY